MPFRQSITYYSHFAPLGSPDRGRREGPPFSLHASVERGGGLDWLIWIGWFGSVGLDRLVLTGGISHPHVGEPNPAHPDREGGGGGSPGTYTHHFLPQVAATRRPEQELGGRSAITRNPASNSQSLWRSGASDVREHTRSNLL